MSEKLIIQTNIFEPIKHFLIIHYYIERQTALEYFIVISKIYILNEIQ